MGRVHDRAAIGRMALDHLAGPFRIEQILEALRRVAFFDEVGVVLVGERGWWRLVFLECCVPVDVGARVDEDWRIVSIVVLMLN